MTESPPQAQQGFSEPTLELLYKHWTQPKGLSWAHSPHGTGTQGKKIAESGSQQTAQGLGRKVQLSLTNLSQHRDSAEEGS